MGSDGGLRAWAFLQRNPVYRAAWREVAERPDFESTPFPVRIQSPADRPALAWGLLAWENSQTTSGPASPFWAGAPMLEGEWTAPAPPLWGVLARSGARLEGLRLADGTLILKIENGSQVVQVRIGPGPAAGTGTVLVLARIAQPIGLRHDRQNHPLRIVGTAATGLSTLVLGGVALWQAVGTL